MEFLEVHCRTMAAHTERYERRPWVSRAYWAALSQLDNSGSIWRYGSNGNSALRILQSGRPPSSRLGYGWTVFYRDRENCPQGGLTSLVGQKRSLTIAELLPRSSHSISIGGSEE
jgi:hypothetical protein